jgi:hypothetical protein
MKYADWLMENPKDDFDWERGRIIWLNATAATLPGKCECVAKKQEVVLFQFDDDGKANGGKVSRVLLCDWCEAKLPLYAEARETLTDPKTKKLSRRYLTKKVYTLNGTASPTINNGFLVTARFKTWQAFLKVAPTLLYWHPGLESVVIDTARPGYHDRERQEVYEQPNWFTDTPTHPNRPMGGDETARDPNNVPNASRNWVPKCASDQFVHCRTKFRLHYNTEFNGFVRDHWEFDRDNGRNVNANNALSEACLLHARSCFYDALGVPTPSRGSDG